MARGIGEEVSLDGIIQAGVNSQTRWERRRPLGRRVVRLLQRRRLTPDLTNEELGRQERLRCLVDAISDAPRGEVLAEGTTTFDGKERIEQIKARLAEIENQEIAGQLEAAALHQRLASLQPYQGPTKWTMLSDKER